MSHISNNENKINYFIGKLPKDILHHIYIEYISDDLICSELNVVLKSIESQNFICEPLVEFLKKKVLNNV